MIRFNVKEYCVWLFLFLLACGGMAQEESGCLVLMEAISGSYEGDCRDGLAHGKGKAMGWDTYRGQFKDGLPHGKGTYIWENGNKWIGKWKNGMCHGRGKWIIRKSGLNQVIRGIWKDGKMVREFQKNPYKITYMNGVERVRIYRNGERNLIEIYPIRRGSGPLYRYLRLNTSSGVRNMERRPYTIAYPMFPFEGAVYFEAPNQFMAYMKMCEVEYKINEPGRWVIEIYY